MSLRKKILNVTHPVLRRLAFWYLSKPRTVRFKNVSVNVLPGVFHPGLFFSTKALLKYIVESPVALEGKRVLELGAGSGLLSVYCASRGATVTATDISAQAIANLQQNARLNNLPISIIESDLFEHVSPNEFDTIFINPPYYPRDPANESEMAWYCGSDFGYFKKLFEQLRVKRESANNVFMILSEDCSIETLQNLAKQYCQEMHLLSCEQFWGEKNFIYSIKSE